MKYCTLRKKVETTPLQICEKGKLEVFGLSEKISSNNTRGPWLSQYAMVYIER